MKEWLISKLEVRLQDDAKVFCIDSRWWNDNDFKIVFSFVIQNQLERDCNTQKIWPYQQQPPKDEKSKRKLGVFAQVPNFFRKCLPWLERLQMNFGLSRTNETGNAIYKV